jgi:hypothetical protein
MPQLTPHPVPPQPSLARELSAVVNQTLQNPLFVRQYDRSYSMIDSMLTMASVYSAEMYAAMSAHA